MTNRMMNNDYVLRRSNVLQNEKVNQQKQKQTSQRPFGPSFQDVLGKVQQSGKEVKFSKHAMSRLQTRNINLDQKDLEKIEGAVNKAASKGIKEALILMDNKAFIANVKNRTIITAATDDQLKEQVFTNIDGAVIV